MAKQCVMFNMTRLYRVSDACGEEYDEEHRPADGVGAEILACSSVWLVAQPPERTAAR